jgi:hypothetical protein
MATRQATVASADGIMLAKVNQAASNGMFGNELTESGATTAGDFINHSHGGIHPQYDSAEFGRHMAI